MRHPLIAAALAGSLLLACSEQPTETAQDSLAVPHPAFAIVSCGANANAIKSAIDQLFPSGSLRNSAQSQFKSIPPKTNKPTGTAARDKTFNLIGFILTNYRAGKLTAQGTQENVLGLIAALDCLAGIPQQTIPPGALDPDGAAAVITPTSPLTTVKTGTGHAGVQVPTGSVSQPVLVTITRLPDSPGPLLTSLDQFPLFYEFTSSPTVTFNLSLVAGVCLQNNVDNPENLRLAHNVGTAFGQVEVLPSATAGFLDCSTLGLGSARRTGWNHFAWAETLLLPADLHATTSTLITTAVGGTTKKFSPFGAVDIFSNPGSLAPVGPTVTSEPVGATVTRTVHVMSQDSAPIARVPVTFATTNGTLAGSQPVLTDASGNATVSWTLPGSADVYTLTATVTNVDSPPVGPGPAGGNVAFTPDVQFGPSSITFTVAASSDGILTPLSCGLEGSIRSLNSNTAVNVTFVNNTDQYVSVYWLNFDGLRDYPFGGGIGFPYRVLAPGEESYVQSTFVTHPWILIGDSGGDSETCYGVFLPLSPSEGTDGGTANASSPIVLQ